MTLSRWARTAGLVGIVAAIAWPVASTAQDNSGNQNWSSTSEQGSPGGSLNASRMSESHTQSGDRTTDKTSMQTMGPDGRYVPYSDIEKESVRVNDTTVRTIERVFGRDADGNRTLVQERQEETRRLADGEEKVSRTISNPDANGGLQVVQRETEDSKQISPGVRVTNTTVSTADGNGGFAPAVQTQQRETKGSDGTLETRKSTLLSDGTGGWKLSEVRESTTRQDGQGSTKEERVLRPDGEGKLALTERTVSKEAKDSAGEKRGTTEKYSANVPGVATDGGLQLVQRETTVQRTNSAGGKSTARQVEQPKPGESGGSMNVTQEAIDIVRPGNGAASQTQVILTPQSDGRIGQVWVDMGKTDNPAAVKVDSGGQKK